MPSLVLTWLELALSTPQLSEREALKQRTWLVDFTPLYLNRDYCNFIDDSTEQSSYSYKIRVEDNKFQHKLLCNGFGFYPTFDINILALGFATIGWLWSLIWLYVGNSG